MFRRFAGDAAVEIDADFFFDDIDMRTDQMIEQQVSLNNVGAFRGASPAEDEVNIEAGLRASRRRLAAIVALHASPPHDDVGLLAEGVSNQELVVPGLVAAKGETRAVIALDENPRSAEGPGESLGVLQGRGIMAERISRQSPNGSAEVGDRECYRGIRHGVLGGHRVEGVKKSKRSRTGQLSLAVSPLLLFRPLRPL